ncbi:multiple monosaccharide ABC transporter permease [Trueperella pyogenes]|uniref:Xylose transport system permease protein XylH n=1 Tax=Trueperella pyogenes TaxID=1661 RepID=A0A380MCI9_9ACTO|nr:multiple monosaccharide ABC transporter permease [Trueperella pyogenes]AJC70112.1 ABC transporter permease [Trueperella pyogenes TP8]AZR07401.1 sugar ABC transporter permease [Trueperella pyogenes]MBB3025117.1 putative multiple sugar transport system permease protein [Trueperella pyogenes]MCI7690649.1 sugar ABC transporter permease [Trueperella pyogenes]QIU87617.1 sugar ABC transporter permease [Trueperella pyogenes]
MKSVISQALKQYGLLLALVVIVVLFQVLTKGLLLNPNNVASLIQQNAYVMILAIGMVMVIVARHIDLSVGSVVAFVGGVVALLMYDLQLPWFPAVLVGVAIGALIGCWQGFWVAYVGIPAFIVTLAGMLIFRGLAIVLVERTVSGLPTGFVKIANGSVPNSFGFVGQLDVMTLAIGLMTIVALAVVQFRGRAVRAREGMAESMGLFLGRLILISALIGYLAYLLALSAGGTPIILVIIGFLVIVYTFIMNYTRFGRHVYAVGGNLKAAQLSGIRTKRVDFLVFVNMGVLSAFAGIVTTSRAGAAVATAGNTYELDAIAAAYIGGAAVSGGIGKVSGAIVGALVMGVINMGLSILSVDSAYQQAIKGLVVLFAVAFDLATQKRRS